MFLLWVGGIFFNLAQDTPLQSFTPNTTQLAQSTNAPKKEVTPDASNSIPQPEVTITHPEIRSTPNEPPLELLPTPQHANTASVTLEKPQPRATQPAYNYPPLSLDVVHTATVPAIVNILCLPQRGSHRVGVTGTGILIDPRGIVLTNAHVAQYLVLKDYPTPNTLACALRTGSPARAHFYADVLFFPSDWAKANPKTYAGESATGTGEHDWALLYITESSKEYTIGTLPFITPDPRIGMALPGNEMLVAGYPASFLSSDTIAHDLWMVSTIATVRELFTFSDYTPDVFSVGGTIVAQGGISGGPAVNAWGRLIGIAVTASEGKTTDERDLRFVSLSHINTDIQHHTGLTLAEFIAGDTTERTNNFYQTQKDSLVQLLTQ